MSIMTVTDIILHLWLSIPEYLHKISKSMHIQVIVINNFFLLRFRLENRTVKDSFSVILCCYLRYLLKICSEGEIKF